MYVLYHEILHIIEYSGANVVFSPYLNDGRIVSEAEGFPEDTCCPKAMPVLSPATEAYPRFATG